jgi:hypothetical protein
MESRRQLVPAQLRKGRFLERLSNGLAHVSKGEKKAGYVWSSIIEDKLDDAIKWP